MHLNVYDCRGVPLLQFLTTQSKGWCCAICSYLGLLLSLNWRQLFLVNLNGFIVCPWGIWLLYVVYAHASYPRTHVLSYLE